MRSLISLLEREDQPSDFLTEIDLQIRQSIVVVQRPRATKNQVRLSSRWNGECSLYTYTWGVTFYIQVGGRSEVEREKNDAARDLLSDRELKESFVSSEKKL